MTSHFFISDMSEQVFLDVTNDKSFSFQMGIRGYHFYRSHWKPYENEELFLERDQNNKFDICAVEVVKHVMTFFGKSEIKTVGHVPLEISRYIFHAIWHGCRFILYVSSARCVRSPITKGGLEIESSVTAIWDNKANFLILKHFIEENYSFSNRLEDHSASILKEIFEGLELGDTENVDDELSSDDDNILMIPDEHPQEDIEPQNIVHL